MSHLSNLITQKLIIKMENDLIHSSNKTNNDSGLVEQNPALKPLFYICLIIGIIFGVWATIDGELIAGIILFLLFGGLSIPVLISYKTCWIKYDEEGFIRSTYFGTKTRYLWNDIIGLKTDEINTIIEVKDKRIKLNETWINKNSLVDKIKEKSKTYKTITDKSLPVGIPEIVQSYNDGIFKEALIVSKKYLNEYKKYKILSYTVVGFIFVASYSFFFAPSLIISILAFVVANIAVPIGKFIYYKNPEIFTMREKPGERVIKVENHKLATSALFAISGMSNIISLLIILAFEYEPVISTLKLIVLLVIGFSYIIDLIIYKKKSWEYKEYKIGFISFSLLYFFYILSLILVISFI